MLPHFKAGSDSDRDTSAGLDLADGARVKRACERWPLLELVRRVGSARRSSQRAAAPGSAPVGTGPAWWES